MTLRRLQCKNICPCCGKEDEVWTEIPAQIKNLDKPAPVIASYVICDECRLNLSQYGRSQPYPRA